MRTDVHKLICLRNLFYITPPNTHWIWRCDTYHDTGSTIRYIAIHFVVDCPPLSFFRPLPLFSSHVLLQRGQFFMMITKVVGSKTWDHMTSDISWEKTDLFWATAPLQERERWFCQSQASGGRSPGTLINKICSVVWADDGGVGTRS